MATAAQQHQHDAQSTAAVPEAPSLASSPVGSRSTHTFNCPRCKHPFHVSGLGRHRVYSELSDEAHERPVMDGLCPECGLGLPG